MVFSSVPLYLDPPNWQQHQNQQLQGNGGGNHHEINQHHHHLPPPQPPSHHQVGLGGGSGEGGGGGGGAGGGTTPIRANSMAERARMAKIPPPEAPLKCPRCDSTNTKFCYFNNYSLSQPRHFCKTCRRYWTRGGALRNVPVGGGCRRNKRSSSNSKSSSSTSSAATTTNTSKSSSSLSTMGAVGIPSGGFMASLQNIAQLGMSNLGLSFTGSTTSLHNTNSILEHIEHYGGNNSSNSNINAILNHHQSLNFPSFLGGFEIPGSSSSSFQNVSVGGDDDGKGMPTNMSSMLGVKMENINSQGGGLNMEKGLLMGMNSNATPSSGMMNGTSTTTMVNNDGQFWGGGGNTNNMWSSHATHNLAGLNSSSTTTTSHLM